VATENRFALKKKETKTKTQHSSATTRRGDAQKTT
jgi:hypothetical protein